jgi:GNAT superfamily N-acetyltransferase
MRIRQWRHRDAPRLPGLLEPAADPLWVDQFHALHGPDRDNGVWRRTLVAVDGNDQMIGCATVTENPLHGGRFPCAVDVAPSARRRGVGTVLVEEIRALRADPSRPLSTKVRQQDCAAMAFVSSIGGRVYQTSPCAVVDPRAPGVQRWARSRSDRDCRTLEGIAAPEVARAFATIYNSIHRLWSPVTDDALLDEVAAQEATDVDRRSSVGVWSDGRLVAAAFTFRSAEGFEVVAETVRGDEPGGFDAVADAVAMVIRLVARRDAGLITFDSHLGDPHLQPVLPAIPHARSDPLDLIEID